MAQILRLLARRRFVGLMTLPLLLRPSAANSAHRQTRKTSDRPEPISAGMVALLATPERYDGKFIRTIGFVGIEFENDALYLHEEDYRYGEIKNSFALRLTDSQRKDFKGLSLNRVLIEGRVYANGLESDEWGGAIGNISRLERWEVNRVPVPER